MLRTLMLLAALALLAMPAAAALHNGAAPAPCPHLALGLVALHLTVWPDGLATAHRVAWVHVYLPSPFGGCIVLGLVTPV